MRNTITIRGRTVVIPTKLIVKEMRPAMVGRLLRSIRYDMWNLRGDPPVVDVIKLQDKTEVCITTKRVGNAIYWLVTDFLRRQVWAGGSFTKEGPIHQEESAAAHPMIRGRGLYKTVLRYIRKEYKRPLISDRIISYGNLVSWIRAGGVVDHSDERMRINPMRNDRIRCFLALETVG